MYSHLSFGFSSGNSSPAQSTVRGAAGEFVEKGLAHEEAMDRVGRQRPYRLQVAARKGGEEARGHKHLPDSEAITRLVGLGLRRVEGDQQAHAPTGEVVAKVEARKP